jgi:hypothetical protein
MKGTEIFISQAATTETTALFNYGPTDLKPLKMLDMG